MKSLMEKHKCPENIPNMQVPRTNTEVWDNMSRGNQVVDNATQRIQSLQVHALSAILSIINAIGTGNGGLSESHLGTLTDATRMLTMSFSSLLQVRKELIRNSLGFPLAKFCTWETVVGAEVLFTELSKKLKDRDETQYKLRRKKSR